MDKKSSLNISGDVGEKHQHNTAPQYLRYVQQSLKIPPNNQHHPHIHQAYQPSSKYNGNNSNTNIHSNPLHVHISNQYIYQQNQIKQITPAAYPVSSSILHTSPQPWVPIPAPANYAKPNDLPLPQTSAPTPGTTMQTTSNKHQLERKKSGSQQQLRSPSAKRPTNATVTLQGWLHKQGSDGLMLWKKRWFVLSEYVLFYYKGAEEEKLLGSILLPSYIVSMCGRDDKVNRKYAFKCEHTNMRTYILAADSHELMMHWIRELTLACILQTNVDPDTSVITSNHRQQPQKPTQLPLTQPLTRLHSASNTTAEISSNPSQDSFNQPLYVNAPPKPRRLTDAEYSSPSPPEMFDRYNEPKYVTLQQPPPYNVHQRGLTHPATPEYGYHDYVERRTPDTYGRPKTCHVSDYEDIYAEHLMYKQPLRPLAYDQSNAVTTSIPRMYETAAPGPPTTIPRPHSADFLEYEITHREETKMNVVAQPTRPKSSLEINRNAADNYFYTEERYAEKMRKSAQYLSKLPVKWGNPTQTRSHNAQAGEYVSIRKDAHLAQPQRSRSVLSEGSITKELVDLGPQYKMHRDDEFYQQDFHEYDPFTRSASARLANIEKRLQGDGRASMNKEGERKREESMKRLLEWKQRMLQSPLNRKVNQNVNKSYKSDYYKHNNSYTNQMMDAQLVTMGHNHYNSNFSSDDEENVDAMQAGRTVDTTNAQPCEASAAPHTASTSLLAPSIKQCKANDKTCSSTTPIHATNHAPSKPGTGALVKSIVADITKRTEGREQHSCGEIIEENYMPMTPKKGFFIPPPPPPPTIEDEEEEDPYVEMTQRLMTKAILDPCNMHQPYEIVNFEKGNTEPLYMELSHGKQGQEQSISKLPDILIPMQSIEEPIYATNPRFSLSDTFRPASYYLGASPGTSQSMLPEHDSSDSEIVSPPPIPRSPPPLDDLGSEEVSQISAFDDGDISMMEQENELEMKTMTPSKDMDPNCQQWQSASLRLLKRRRMSESIDGELTKTELIKYLKKIDGEYSSGFDNNQYHEYENMIVAKFTTTLAHERQASRDSENTSTLRRSETSSLDGSKVTEKMLEFQNAHNFNAFLGQSAPYYYSDLGLNSNLMLGSDLLTLNNQRGTHNGSKRDIHHIINPIRCNNTTTSLESEMNMNSFDQFQLANEARSVSMDFLNLTDKAGQIDKKNVYESDTLKRAKGVEPTKAKNDKLNYSDASRVNENIVRRTHSLEGLLENVLLNDEPIPDTSSHSHPNNEGSYLWEEDAVWRERLRNASQRHTKSLDDLDIVGCPNINKSQKSARAITRGVVYVNDNVYNTSVQSKYVKSKDAAKGQKENFTIDREKLRQWDLMSSAPSDAEDVCCERRANREGTQVCAPTVVGQAEEADSGSPFIQLHDTFSRTSLQPYNRHEFVGNQSRSTSNLNFSSCDGEYGMWQEYYANRDLENRKLISNKQNLSAGDLLGRTHEELVLLLIQLRRQSTTLCYAIESGYNEIDKIQAQQQLMDSAKRLTSLQKLEQIKQHLLDLEKQYEKGKPLVNLVDNMVKLGSLYRFPKNHLQATTFTTRERSEFNQQVQERKLLAEEQRDWHRMTSSHDQLQEKVDQLYELDQMIHEGSGALQELQQDKEEIERALVGIKQQLLHGYHDPEVVESARKQQAVLENELSRVHLMLAENSKKLEETVAGNARLEQELLVLKHKLQVSKHARGSPPSSIAGDSFPCILGTNSALMESDLQKVQLKVGDLHKQRQELSMQVKQLTDRSSLQLNRMFSPSHQDAQKKLLSSQWRETDLDTMHIYNHNDQWTSNSSISSSIPSLYQKLDDRNAYLEDSTSGILIPNAQQEKQEIKTVRIVKRASERRQRDRDRDKPPAITKYDALPEDDSNTTTNSSRSHQLLHLSLNVGETSNTSNRAQSAQKEVSPVLSPVFKSEAARQIITEMSQEVPRQPKRRAVPLEKRRHYTAPNNNLIKSLNPLPTGDDDDGFDKMLETRRARDDLDMERALRNRNEPDVVRSTFSSKELKYNENTIDSILGTPNKIFIPERYIPEQLPQLSAEEEQHRLRKVESIKKMLSESAILSTSSANLAGEENEVEAGSSTTNTKSTAKIEEEKKQREHLLQMNQILAKQVMEMSKIVAVKALQNRPEEREFDSDDDSSPESTLPLYQQRDNFYS